MTIEVSHDPSTGRLSFLYKRHVFVALGLLLVGSGLATLTGPWWQSILEALLGRVGIVVQESYQWSLALGQIIPGLALLGYKHFVLDRELARIAADRNTVAVDGVLVGAMGRRPHDLVVPLVSAIAYGESQPLLRCPHNRYFLETSVRHAISAFFAPASDRPSVATAGPIKVLAPIVMKKAPPVPTTRPKSPRTQKSAGT